MSYYCHLTRSENKIALQNPARPSSGRQRRKQKLCWTLWVIVIVLAIYFVWDYRGPSEIPLHPHNLWELAWLRAEDLVVQGYDPEGCLWATRGMIAYRLCEDDSKFLRQYHIPTGFSIYWFLNFSFMRQLTGKHECAELLPMSDGAACTMTAGRMWYRPAHGKDFKQTLTLRHYGFGVGRGILNGLARLSDGTILFGEYFRNEHHGDVNLYSSRDNGRTWQITHVFPPGHIRHVHAVQQDPYTEKVWICTGDGDEESMVAWSSDGGKTPHPIGQGSQVWRVCQLAFTKEALYFGTATQSTAVSGIYRWDRKTHELSKLVEIKDKVSYATKLSGGTIVLTASKTDNSSRTRLFLITIDGRITSIVCGTRASRKALPILRMQRDQGGPWICVSCLNQTECNGDLLIIPERQLVAAAARRQSERISED